MSGKSQKINVKMLIDTEFSNAQKQIENISQQLGKIQLGKKNNDVVNNLASELKQFQQILNQISSMDLNAKNISDYTSKVERLKLAWQESLKTITQVKDSLNDQIFSQSAKRNNLISQIEQLTGQQFDSSKTGKEAGLVTEEQLKTYKKLKGEITKITKQIGSLEEQRGSVVSLANSFGQLNAAVQAAENSVEVANRRLKEFQNNEMSEGLRNLVTRFFGFNAVLEATKTTVREAYDTISRLDEGLTSIAAVTGKSRDQMWEMVGSYNKMAVQLGTTTKQIVEASKLYYQQGRTQSQTTELVEQTAILATTAEIDYATATDYLTAAINGYNIEASEAYRVTDSWSALAAASAVDVNELAVAMSKVASLAAASGLELENASAFLSKMLETTREAPENLGTALKTIISRFQELSMSEEELTDGISANDVETALKSAGVALRDASGQFRNFDDVLLDLSKNWDGLSVNTQKYIATAAAGSRQQSRFIALVSDYERNLELIDIAQDSAGASLGQFATQMTGLQASLNRVTAAWEGFYTSFSQGPSIISGTLDITANFINTLNALGGAGTALTGVIVGLTTVILVKNAATAIEFKEDIKATQGILNKANGIKYLTQVTIAETAAKLKNLAVNVAISAGYAAVGVAIAALVKLTIDLVTAKQREIKATEDAAQAAKEEAAQHQSAARSTKSLLDEYNNLYKSGQDLSDIKQKIIDQFAGEISGIEQAVESYGKLNQVLQDYIDLQNSEAGSKTYKQYTLQRNLELEEGQSAKKLQSTLLGQINTETVVDPTDLRETILYTFYNDTGELLFTSEDRKEVEDWVKENYPAEDIVSTITQTQAEMIAAAFKYEKGIDADSKVFQALSFSSGVWEKVKYDDGSVGQQLTDSAIENLRDYSKALEFEFKQLSEDEQKALQEYLNKDFSNVSIEQNKRFKEILNKALPNLDIGTEISNFFEEEISNLEEVLKQSGIEENISKNLSPAIKRGIVEALNNAKDNQELKDLISETYNNLFKLDPGTIGDFDLGDAISNLDLTDANQVSDLGAKILQLGKDTSLTSEEVQTLGEVYNQLIPFMVKANQSFQEISNSTKDYYSLIDTIGKAGKATEGLDADNFNILAQSAKEYGLALEYGINSQGKFVVAKGSLINLLELERQKTIEDLEAQKANALVRLKAIESTLQEQKAEQTSIKNNQLHTESLLNVASGFGQIIRAISFLVPSLSSAANAIDNTIASVRNKTASMASAIQVTEEMRVQTEEEINALDAYIEQLKSSSSEQIVNNAITDSGTSSTNKATSALEKQKDALEKQKRALEKSKRPYEKQIKALEKDRKALEKDKKALEKNVKALEKQKEALEDQKEALEDQKEAIEEHISLLEKQKEALENQSDALKDNIDLLADTLKNKLQAELTNSENAVENYYQALDAALGKLIESATDDLDSLNDAYEQANKLAEDNSDSLEKQSEDILSFYDKQIEAIQAKIDAIQKERESLEELQALQEARDAYEQAKQKTRLVLIEGAGWRFRTDKTALEDSATELATAEADRQVQILEQQIEYLENIKQQWEEIAENIGKSVSELEEAAKFQEYLSSLSTDELKNLQDKFKQSVQQNNYLYENALKAQQEYEKQNDKTAEGTLAWQIEQWKNAQEQSKEDQDYYQTLIDENAKAIEQLKQELLNKLGGASSTSISEALANGIKISEKNAQQINAINATLDALEILLEKVDMTSAQIAEYDNIQNLISQASLDQLLQGGSIYNQLQGQIDQSIAINDQIKIVEQQIESLESEVEKVELAIRDVEIKIEDVDRSIELVEDAIEAVEDKIEVIDDQIDELNDQIDLISDQIDEIDEQIEDLDDAISGVEDAVSSGTSDITGALKTGFSTVVGAINDQPVVVQNTIVQGGGGGPSSAQSFAKAEVGGVDTEAGYLEVHGSKNRPELILNNSQSAGLFRFIDGLTKAPSITDAYSRFGAVSSSSNNNTDNSTKFSNCKFEIKTNGDNLDSLIRDLKRQTPFR